MWRNNGDRCFKTVMIAGLAGLLAACEATFVPDLPPFNSQSGVGGLVVADEPQAVLLTRDILNAGGAAADAAVALGFGLSVTLQSRAGLGGGGACLVYDVETRRSEVLDFRPVAATGNAELARWQVAVPALARGLFALHAKYGRLPWQQVVVPAENAVRFQNTVSRAFARDLSTSSSVLVNDPAALDTFMTSGRRMAQEGNRLEQLDLAATIGRLRGRTPGGFYSGGFARQIEEAATRSGASLSANDLRGYAPVWREPGSSRKGRVVVYQSPDIETADGASSFDDAVSSTGFVVADSNGNVVSCALTMITPFGNGLMPPGLGFLLSPSPDLPTQNMPDLASSIAVDIDTGYVVYASTSGGFGANARITKVEEAVLDQDQKLADVLTERSENGLVARPQVNAFHCARGLQRDIRACDVQADPSGHGFGLIAVGEQ